MAESSLSVSVPLGNRSYEILIGHNLLREVGPRLRGLGLTGKVAIVTNPTVRRLYGSLVKRSLREAGYDTHTILVPDGEQTKNLHRISNILNELLSRGFERNSVLVALGGGVVGDITGFVAAIYLRGVPYVQVGTSLVAQVDSSIGGKTGVNHPLGKNLIGAFHQPRLVVLDTGTLRTLPKREWVAGLAEVIKYGMIADEAFFSYLEERMDRVSRMEPEVIQHVVKRCCEIKASVVGLDEREGGLRRILNYGHTVGHALEALGRYKKLLHGEAVALGMIQEAEFAHWLGLCSVEVARRQRTIVQRAGLPDQLPHVGFSMLWSAMQHDKKVARGQVHCVLPRCVGEVEISILECRDVKAWFQNRKRKSTSLKMTRKRKAAQSI